MKRPNIFAQNAIVFSLLEPDMEAEVAQISEADLTQAVIEKEEPKVVVKTYGFS